MSEQIGFKKLRETATTVLQGDYPVVADKVTYKRTQTDKPMWTVTLKVTAGPYAGRAIQHYMVLNGELDFAVKRFFREMAAFGADDAFFDTEPTPDAVSFQIQGRHAIATFEEGEEYRGEKREKVTNLVAAKGGGITVAGSSSLPKAASLPSATAVTTAVAVGEAPVDPF